MPGEKVTAISRKQLSNPITQFPKRTDNRIFPHVAFLGPGRPSWDEINVKKSLSKTEEG